MSDFHTGIQFPLESDDTVFKYSTSILDAAISHIKMLVLTKKGERPGRPEFGSSIRNQLFESLSPNIETALEDEILAYVPEVKSVKIKVIRISSSTIIVECSIAVFNDMAEFQMIVSR
jgi:phage baseplate assembly protein W